MVEPTNLQLAKQARKALKQGKDVIIKIRGDWYALHQIIINSKTLRYLTIYAQWYTVSLEEVRLGFVKFEIEEKKA
jgi:hypothetical protein